MDSDHDRDQITTRLITGILIYVDRVPIVWLNKRKNTAETSTHRLELVTMRLAVEMVKELKYKLWIFRIDIMENETKPFDDSNSVIVNILVPVETPFNQLQLRPRGGCSESCLNIQSRPKPNPADLSTKLLEEIKTKKFVQKILD